MGKRRAIENLLPALLVASACGQEETATVCQAPDPEAIPVATGKRGLEAAFSEERLLTDDVVGVSLRHPAAWSVTKDDRLFETYGFMLRGEDDDLHDVHGALPVARIALDYAKTPDDIEDVVRAKMEEYPGVEMTKSYVELAGRQAIVLGPVPGGQVSTNIYLPIGERLYRINYYGETLDDRAKALIASMEFAEPVRTVESLGLPRAQDFLLASTGPMPKAADLQIAKLYRGLSTETIDECEASVSVDAVEAAEQQLDNGCWTQPSSLFIQTSHSWDANGTGWSRMGTPNFWGENTHGNWGLGRCTSGFYTNDLYAIDFFLRRGDRLYSPFASGIVRYAGWDPENWWNYGNMVVISSPNGKFWSLSAHLSQINVRVGQSVDEDTLIGWAGSTGYADPYPHVHQVFYRWPSNSFGRPYGGRGLRQTHLTYLGNGGGVYHAFSKGKWTSW